MTQPPSSSLTLGLNGPYHYPHNELWAGDAAGGNGNADWMQLSSNVPSLLLGVWARCRSGDVLPSERSPRAKEQSKEAIAQTKAVDQVLQDAEAGAHSF